MRRPTDRYRSIRLLRRPAALALSDSLAELEQQAGQLGADAVVGVDIDYGSVGSQMLMISASGTAVKLA